MARERTAEEFQILLARELAKLGQKAEATSTRLPAKSICPTCGDEYTGDNPGYYLAEYPDGHTAIVRCPDCDAGQRAEEKERERLNKLYTRSGMSGDRVQAHLDDMPDDTRRFCMRLLQDRQVMVSRHAYRGLYLWGDVGTGKTYLASAIINASFALGGAGLFTRVIDLLNELRGCYDPEATMRFTELIKFFRDAPLLVLDDWGAQKESEWAREQLYNIVDARFDMRKAVTIITSNHSIGELSELCDATGDYAQKRILSRLSGMLYEAHMDGADRRQKGS